MGEIYGGFWHGLEGKKEVAKEAPSDPRQKFDKLSRETEELYGGAFSKNFERLKEAAESFGEIDMLRLNYLSLKAYREEIVPVINKFVKSMIGCKKAFKGLEKRFRAMIDLAEKHPELLKWGRFIEEMNEIEGRINDALVKIEKYEKMLDNVEKVQRKWPDTNSSSAYDLYKYAQRSVGGMWKALVNEESSWGELAMRGRHYTDEIVHNFVVEDESKIVPRADTAIRDAVDSVGDEERETVSKAGDIVVKVGKKVIDRAIDESIDFINEEDE